MEPRIIPRADHRVSRRDIDPDALHILYRLHRSGYKGYLVGGGVRDLMLGITPKDFDIATDARPNRLKKLFRNCRIIGRRFRLAHMHYPPDKIIEVATFRSSGKSDAVVRDGDLIQRDNVYGSPGEDARRRDITINGLFYSIADFSVIDYVGGVDDLRNGIVRTIVDPCLSLREDPVRLLRVIRHATRLGFDYDDETRRALLSERDEILKANPTRVLEEFYKDLASGKSRHFFNALHEFKLLKILLPTLVDSFRQRAHRSGKALFFECLDRLDARVRQSGEVTHPLAIAAFFSPIILPVGHEIEEHGVHPGELPWEPFREALAAAFEHIKIYRRDEDRLWHALGAWPKVAQAFRKNKIPAALARRHYFPDAAEIYALLEEESPELEEFVEQVRRLPPPEPAPPPAARKRRRRRRSPGDGREGGAAGGRGESRKGPKEPGGEGSKPSGSGRRRRRRRRSGSASRGQ